MSTPPPLMAPEQAERVEPPQGVRDQGPHWIVGTHHRLRTASFLNAFAFCGAQIWGLGSPGAVWWLGCLVFLFLLYPHLVYWRACRAADSQKAEFENIDIDCFLVALVVGGMGFPLWPTFALFISTGINNAIVAGRWGMARAVLLFATGGLLGWTANGFALAPAQHPPWVTALSVFGLSWYLLVVGSVAHHRVLALRSIRERLRGSESALQQANLALTAQLDEIRSLQAQLEQQAVRDPLTGLYNRRYLQSTMARELARCERENQPLSVMLIDLDDFKMVNDVHGHQVGDEVLRNLGGLLLGGAREADVPCRFGGEEFMLLLPGMPLETARTRAERWREDFKRLQVPSSRGLAGTTLSIGLACFPQHGVEPEDLIRQADRALYAAKAGGRDRVVAVGDPDDPGSRVD